MMIISILLITTGEYFVEHWFIGYEFLDSCCKFLFSW